MQQNVVGLARGIAEELLRELGIIDASGVFSAGGSQFTTIGPTNGDHPTLREGLAAGKRFFQIIEDTNEDQDIPVPDASVYVEALPDVVHSHDEDVEYTNAAYQDKFIYNGRGSEIAYSFSGFSNGLFAMINAGSGEFYSLGQLTINNSTSGSSKSGPLCRSNLGQKHLGSITFNAGNCQTSGISMQFHNSFLNRCHFIGGGTSCSHALQLSATGKLGTVSFEGTFNSSAGRPALDVNGDSIDPYLLENVRTFFTNTGVDLNLITCRILQLNVGNSPPDIIFGSRASIHSGDLGSSTITMNDENLVENCAVQFSLVTWAAFADNSTFRNCFGGFTLTLTVGGPGARIIDNFDLLNITFNSSADFGQARGNLLGNFASPGGTGKITFDAGADNGLAVANIVDEATVNNGTNNTIGSNTVY